jgi:ABC-type multidrug transport system fused ATPase/permease subunit
MKDSRKGVTLQRAIEAPPLPATPFRFVLHFVARRRWQFLAIVALEAANSTCSISIPVALSRIIKAVTRAQAQSLTLLETLARPLLLFLGLGLGEVLFGSLGRSIQLRVSPRQRQEVTREVYAYLQHHSYRYFSNNFAGALVHRISEMSQGVNMTRMHDPQSGQILIDGFDIRAFTQESLHAQLSLIPQDPSLFHRSLKENIRYGRLSANDADVETAARRAYAHEFIEEISEKYESMVGERGVKLSGGQRQRIAIARVILKDAPVLILDEATSSLDSITEKAIQNSLDEAMNGKTVIVVAHRLSTIANLDRILVFDRGHIIEDGRPADLIAQQGAYYRLWSKQADGFLVGDTGQSPQSTDAESEATGFVEPPLIIEDGSAEIDDTDRPLIQPVPQLARP